MGLYEDFLAQMAPQRSVQMPDTPINAPVNFEDQVIPPLGVNPAIDPESFIGPTPESWDIGPEDIALADYKAGRGGRVNTIDLNRGEQPQGDINFIDLNNQMEAAARNKPPMPPPEKMAALPTPQGLPEMLARLQEQDVGPPSESPSQFLDDYPDMVGPPVSAAGTDVGPPLSGRGTPENTAQASITEPGKATKLAPRKSAMVMEPYVVNGKAPTGDERYGVPSQPMAPEVEDAIAKLLGLRRDKYGKERDAALAGAKDAEKMTDDDKLAFALLGALPGLIGLLGGAAAGGGVGALAGAAGGLQGGASGMQMIAGEKAGKRKELLAQAKEAGDRLNQVDAQELGRAGELDQRRFGVAQDEKGWARSSAQHKEDQATRAAEAKMDRDARAREGALGRASAKELKTMDLLGEHEKALLRLKEGGGDIKEYQGKTSSFAGKMLAANHVLSQIKKPALINSFADWGSVQNALTSKNPEEQLAARATMNFLDAIARDESGAAINEAEWGRYFNQYMGRNTSSPEDLKYANDLRLQAIDLMKAKSGPQGAKIAQDSFDQRFGAPQMSPALREAQEWLQKNPNDPDAPAVREKLNRMMK